MSLPSLSLHALAPDFTLFDSHKNPIRLSDYRGKQNVLILFFPLAFSGVCTDELCAVRDDFSQYRALNTEVLGIFPDSVFVLEKYRTLEKVNYILLSDFNREVAAQYGALYKDFPALGMKHVPKRAAFVLDKEGKLCYQEVKEVPQELPDFQKIKSLLKELS